MPILKTLRSRVIVSSLAVTFAVLSVLVMACYISLHRFLERSLIQTTSHELRVAMDYIDRDITTLEQMANYLSIQKHIISFVLALDNRIPEWKYRQFQAWETLLNTSYGSSLYPYINKMLVCNRLGNAIQIGKEPGFISDWRIATDTLTGKHRVILDNPFDIPLTEKILLVTKPLYQDDQTTLVGHIFICLDPVILTSYLKGASGSLYQDTLLFLALGDEVFELEERGTWERKNDELLHQALFNSELPGKTFFYSRDDKRHAMVSIQSKATGWILCRSLPTVQFTQQNVIFQNILYLIVIFMMAQTFSILFIINRTVNRPIAMINRRIGVIAEGDFTPDPDIEFHNELGNIGRGINYLSENVERLIENRLQDEATKKDLEFRVLQNQINPHFLYNTLNSIKWMASIQKATGIVEIVASLAVLLRHISNGTNSHISLEQELALVQEYCTIQRYRSSAISELIIHLDDPKLAKGGILKFTLQPIVENALFHGIEPKAGTGIITIHGYKRDEKTLCVSVQDDGVGIAPERIEGLLTTAHDPKKESFNHIGLRNVDERIKLAFGQSYGLEIESILGEYTRVTVVLPWTLV